MYLKDDNHVFIGMERDLDISKHNPLYLYEAYNIRINPRNNDTLLGITNERGPLYKDSYSGKYVGHVVVDNEYIILFLTSANIIKTIDSGDNLGMLDTPTISYESTNREANTGETKLSNKDVILKININDYSYEFLFIGNLNLNVQYLILGIYRYESSHIKKIYWIDGLNLPRMINIEKQYSSIEDNDLISTRYDFILTLSLNESVEVTKCTGGTFATGVIQYAFSYFYLNGQESNLFFVTPLLYIGHKNTKTVNPEGKSGDAFKIDIGDLETKFDYLRIYSIHRTSWNATPECRIVTDIKINSSDITYIDYGNTGSIINPTELFYIGGQVIIPDTMAFKDLTLFLANYKMEMNILRGLNITKNFSFENNFSNYLYALDEDSVESVVPKFKNGEHYLFGILVLDKYGRWSDPLLLDEETVVISGNHPVCNVKCVVSGLPETAVRARGLCIYPTTEQRNILATGVINPTLYQTNSLDSSHKLFQSSWFFRPQKAVFGTFSPTYQFENNTSIFELVGENSNTQHLSGSAPDVTVEIEGGGTDDNNTNFIISYNIVDFYSPDAEFDYLDDSSNSSFKILHVADIGVNGTNSPYDVTEIHLLTIDAASEYNNALGSITRGKGINEHTFLHTYKDGSTTKNSNYHVYPWNSAGSFTKSKGDADYADSFNTPFDSLRSNKLLRWLGGITSFKNEYVDLTQCLYKSYLEENGDSSLEFNGNYYMGQTETLLSTDSIPKWYKELNNVNWISSTPEKRIVEMKYKTCSHLVLLLSQPLYYDTMISPPIPDSMGTILAIGFTSISSAISTIEGVGSTIVYIMKEAYGVLDYSGRDVEHTYTDLSGSTSLFDIANSIYVIARWGKTNNFYLFKVQLHFKNTSQGKMLYDIGCIQLKGTDLSNKYSWGGDINIIYQYYDENGNLHSTLPSNASLWSTDYRGSYILLDGILIREEDNNNNNNNNNNNELVDDTNIGIQIPTSEVDAGLSRLVLADIVNENPVPLQDDVPWVPASSSVFDVENGSTTIIYDIGDTWVLDYHCIKTFPFTNEDDNSITEIIKFPCPTRINLNGRYSTMTSPPYIPLVNREKFSLINKVYSNLNNFFVYSKIKETDTVLNETINSMTWCPENIPNSDIDSNVAISLLNNYVFDEKITSLVTNRLSFYAFHPESISKISFNPRVEVSPSDGAPIELATSKRMYGSDTLINDVGATNKRSIIVTNAGIFFVDSNKRGLYLLGGDEKLTNISESKNFTSWFNNLEWLDSSKLFYDSINSDLYLVGLNDCLVFNTPLAEFVSFMSYEGVPTMFNVGYNFYAFDWYYDRVGLDDNYTSLYHMFNGNYNEFFGLYEPVYIQFISNPNSQYDKIFSTIESRMDVYFGDTLQTDKHFDYIRVWNEYLDSNEVPIFTSPYNRVYANTTGKKKFRIWRVDFPRDNNKINRIRNTWTNLKFGFKSPELLHGQVSNIINANNPNIAKYYNDILDHGLNQENITYTTPKAKNSNSTNINYTDPLYYKDMKMILHDMSISYFIL